MRRYLIGQSPLDSPVKQRLFSVKQTPHLHPIPLGHDLFHETGVDVLLRYLVLNKLTNNRNLHQSTYPLYPYVAKPQVADYGPEQESVRSVNWTK